jgi:hypothetical protein
MGVRGELGYCNVVGDVWDMLMGANWGAGMRGFGGVFAGVGWVVDGLCVREKASLGEGDRQCRARSAGGERVKRISIVFLGV